MIPLLAAFVLQVGWHDEMDELSGWRAIESGNRAEVFQAKPGLLNMRLPRVPEGWPYVYQWSGVTREAIVDLDQFPVLVARVVGANKGSYAHVDVEELDVHGKQSWGMRTSALLAPGLCTLDIGSQHPGIRRLQLRLIIGGPNEGARVGYSYVRFIRRQDLPWLNRNKDWQRVEWVR